MDSDVNYLTSTDFTHNSRDSYAESTVVIPTYLVSFWQTVLEFSIFEFFAWMDSGPEKKSLPITPKLSEILI